ncbi:MAG: glycosyltransferase family protein [Nitrospirae bacterium]|nr:glycosyltransferase family protein [Nitrospirota bacterium]
MILAILQARVSSTRLPGKVLKNIINQPMLLRQIERIRRAGLIDKLIVATSIDQTDNPVEILCKDNDIAYYRGSLDDVLDRFYQAAKPFKADHIVRLTGDCPLTDPALIDDLISYHLHSGYDYISNTLEPTFPDGLDVEVFRCNCLEQAWKEAVLPSQREHVTPFIYQQSDRFKIGNFKNTVDLSRLRWTVDEPADFELISIIYNKLYSANPEFTTNDILALLDSYPVLKTMNTHYERNEGMKKSLDQDLAYLSSTENRNV